MLSGRQAGFISGRIKIKIILVIFAVLSFYAAPIAPCAQSQQNGGLSTPKIQDANLVTPIIPAAPDTSDVDIAASLTEDQLKERKEKISELKELSDEIKAKINEVYDQAIAQLKQALDLEEKKQDYSTRRKNAPADLEKAKELLSKLTAFTAPEVAADMTLTEAEQKLTEATLALEQAKKNAATWENESKRRADRRTKIPEESSIAKQRLDEIKGKLAAVAVEGQNAELVRANSALLMAQQRFFEAQITTNTEELLFFDARRDVLAASRDLAARQLASAEKSAEFWQQKVNDLRKKEADAARKEAIQAEKQASTSHPEIQKIVEHNVELAKEQADLADKVEKTSQYSNAIQEQLTSIDKDFKEVKEKIDKAGNKITDVMGVVLLAKRNELPDIQKNKQQIKSRLTEMSKAQLANIKYDKERFELSDIDQYAANLVIEPPVSDSEREIIKADIIVYLESRRKTLDTINGLYDGYLTVLATLDARETSFIQIAQKYRDFIDKNILWIKSSSALNVRDIPKAVTAIRWLAQPGHWEQVTEVLWTDFRNTPVAYLAIIIVLALSFVLHHRMHRSIVNISEKVLDVNTDSFSHTLKVIVLTIFLAATWPVLILFLRWRLSVNVSIDDFAQALAGGLRDLAIGIFMFELLRHMTMPSGLMQDHFRVRAESLSFTRRHVRWFFSLVIPLTFVLRILQLQQTNDQMYNALGRLIFIAILVMLTIFLVVLLRPIGPIAGPYLKRRPDGWVGRLRYVWYPLCLILPVTFSVLAAMGYFYAAWHLYERLMHTLILVFLVIVFRAMLTRWLIVTRRRLSLIEVQKRKAAALEEALEKNAQSTSIESDMSQQSKSKPEKTIFEISRQTNRLINVIIAVLLVIGLWYVWRDVLPALGALGDTKVWGAAPEIITLGNLVMALIITIMMIIVARNVPGLLEIIILRRLPLDRGVRFAIITICRYILVVVGVVLALTEIGIGWSKVQWLVAAMTVGLGFGLQEIFANFISGLIILFEQPVRVDDVVTVSDVTGTVTKIKIRATTIRKWDQRELIVPNREFITGHLINWTLSDKILRRDFTVGIAYGSDIANAEKTLYEVAGANPLVLENPKPVVLFRGFGDSSLEFELRVYITGIENFIPVWHGINCAIDNAFHKAGIEIAFPQQDLHIRSVKTNIPVDLNRPPEFS